MRQLIISGAFAAMLAVAGCAERTASTRPASTIILSVDEAGKPATDPDEQKVLDAVDMIQSGRFKAAIDGPLAEVIHKYEAKYAGKNTRVFCARTLPEALVYAASVDKAQDGEVDVPVDVIGPAWAMAWWARGYAYNETTHYDNAEAALEKALALSPMNAQYEVELAYAYQRQKKWDKSLPLYKKAEADADISAVDIPDMKCKALRGQGYALVELHRLDEAEQAYKACLKLMPGEKRSLAELSYIRGIKGNGDD